MWGRPTADQDGPRRAASGAVNQKKGDGGLTEAWRDVVERSVGIGYRVAEEQLRFGERIAEQCNEQLNVVGDFRNESQDLTSALFRSWFDLTGRWFDLMSAMVGGRPVSSRSTEPSRREPTTTPEISYVVSSERLVRVCLKVPSAALHEQLSAIPPASIDPSHPTLKKVQISRSEDGKVVTVAVTVPAKQPKAAYRGVVLATDRPVGELVVEVLDEPATEGKLRINLNEATVEELTELNGVGQSTAEKIVKYRNKHKFKKVSDIGKVPGAPKNLGKKIAPFAAVSGKTVIPEQ